LVFRIFLTLAVALVGTVFAIVAFVILQIEWQTWQIERLGGKWQGTLLDFSGSGITDAGLKSLAVPGKVDMGPIWKSEPVSIVKAEPARAGGGWRMKRCVRGRCSARGSMRGVRTSD